MSIAEVAKLAGVSNSTVSRVINNHPRVGAEAVTAVRAAMAELGYTPPDRRPGPKPGGASASRQGATVGFLLLGTSNCHATPAFEALLDGVTRGALKYDVKLVLQPVPDPNNLPSHVLDGALNGLLLHGAIPRNSDTKERLSRFPTVWLMNNDGPDWGDQVVPDAFGVGDKAARYLLDRGHARLAFLNLDLGPWAFRLARDSFAARIPEHDGSFTAVERARSEAERADWPGHAVTAAEEVVKRYTKLKRRPTGLFVADDEQVAVLQPALQRAGVKIGPGEVEIISCNNEQRYLIGLSPRPAEVDIRVSAVGMRGVERLLWRLSNPTSPERIVSTVEPTIVPHTSKPARS